MLTFLRYVFRETPLPGLKNHVRTVISWLAGWNILSCRHHRLVAPPSPVELARLRMVVGKCYTFHPSVLMDLRQIIHGKTCVNIKEKTVQQHSRFWSEYFRYILNHFLSSGDGSCAVQVLYDNEKVRIISCHSKTKHILSTVLLTQVTSRSLE